MKSRVLFGLIFFTAATLSLCGQNFPNLRFSHLTTKDGLSTNQVSYAYRDRHGIMWFGTLKGLNRYDGSGFKIFLNKYGDSTSIPNNHIGLIAEDKEGMLWLDADNILCRFDPVTEKVIAIYRNIGFRSFFFDSQKRLWITEAKSIRQFNYNRNQLINYKVPLSIVSNKQFEFLLTYEDREKNILAVSTRGICKIDTAGKNIAPSPDDIFTPYDLLYQDEEKNFWAGIWPGGLQKIAINETRLHPSLLKDTLVYSIEEWKDNFGINYLLITFSGGIKLVNTKTGAEQNYLPNKNYAESHNISTYPHLYKDAENRIWICHTNGIDIIDPSLQGVQNIYPVNNKNEIDNSHGNASSFYESGDEYWIGCQKNKGLIVYDKKWGIKKRITPGVSGVSGDMSNNINYISRPDENTWLFASNGGVIKKEKTGTIIINPDGNKQMRFTSILPKNAAEYWVTSSDSGVYLLNSRSNTFTRHYKLINDEGNAWGPYTKIFKDNNGKQWVTAYKGLYVYDEHLDSFLFKNIVPADISAGEASIVDAVADVNNTIWFITNYVFASYNTSTGKVTTYHDNSGFTSSNLLNIVTDNLGNVWIKSNTELTCMNKTTGVFTYFDEQSGLPVDNWKQQSLFSKLKNGNLVIGGENIITELNPAVLLNNTIVPPVYLEDVEVNNSRSVIEEDSGGNKTIVLQPGQSNFAAHFGVLNYTLPLKNKYYYKIDELDKNWHTAVGGNLNYNNLKPGTYHLHIKGINSAGTENTTGDSLIVVVRPFFYQTKWFYALCIGAFLFILWQLFKLREKRRRAQQQLRDKIARDLHDDVGSTLSGINIFSKMALQKMSNSESSDIVRKIADRSENMVGAMSDIVWSINPANDSIDKIITRMRAYALDMLEEQNIKVNFSYPSNMSRIKVSLTVRKDFYLIYKEAINNIAKYSQATEVNVSLQSEKNRLVLQIADDGKGFDTSTDSNGNGLKNMKARATNINAEMRLVSKPGEGTSIKLTVPA